MGLEEGCGCAWAVTGAQLCKSAELCARQRVVGGRSPFVSCASCGLSASCVPVFLPAKSYLACCVLPSSTYAGEGVAAVSALGALGALVHVLKDELSSGRAHPGEEREQGDGEYVRGFEFGRRGRRARRRIVCNSAVCALSKAGLRSKQRPLLLRLDSLLYFQPRLAWVAHNAEVCHALSVSDSRARLCGQTQPQFAATFVPATCGAYQQDATRHTQPRFASLPLVCVLCLVSVLHVLSAVVCPRRAARANQQLS